MMGKLWLNFDAQGTGQFQAVIARVLGGFDVVSAQLEVPGAATDLAFGHGEERTYAGCDPLGRNPYLSLPTVVSTVACPAILVGQFHEGQVALNARMAGELLAERGIVRMRIRQAGAPETSITEVTGRLYVNGVVNGRRFTLASVAIEALRLSPSRSSIRITWPTELGAEYLVQFKNDLNTPGRVNTGFAVVGTSADSTIDIVPVESVQRFFRILRLH